jgi:3-oxoacyl-[acyl-carrier-protein] synthase II
MTFTRPQKENRRVVVTGIGIVSPLGLNLKDTWSAALNAKSGIGLIQSFDTENYTTKIAGEVKGFDPENFIPKKELKKMDRFIHLTMAATEEALSDSGFTITESNAQRAGCIMGVGMGGLPMIEAQHQNLINKGPSRVSPFFIPGTISNLAPGHIAMKYNLQGPNYVTTSACASSAHSIGEAANYIRSGFCDMMVTGGSEAAVSEMSIAGFSSMKALSTRNDQPTLASRPFDQDRDGFVMAEGAATLILEDYELAYKRGAKIYGEVLGYGLSCDAHHMTNPSPGGLGASLSMSSALKDSQIDFKQIDYINAHGTSTPVGDLIETEAIKRVFKDHSEKIWVSSTKSMTGHTLGAAGGIESVFSLMALKTNCVPPTINLDTPSEGCDLDYVPGAAREKEIKYVLNNSFGFGGTNATLVFGKI